MSLPSLTRPEARTPRPSLIEIPASTIARRMFPRVQVIRYHDEAGQFRSKPVFVGNNVKFELGKTD